MIAVAALIGGCGSYTKADFSASANAICASTVRKVRSIRPSSFGPGAAAQMRALGGYLGRVLPIVRAEAYALRALKRPAQDARNRAELTRYLRAVGGTVADYAALAAAARRGDAHAVATAEAGLRTSQVGALAASYGLRSCAAPGATVS